MKRFLAVIFILSAIACVSAAAQGVYYPTPLKPIFGEADIAISKLYATDCQTVKDIRQTPVSNFELKIAIPDCPQKEHLMDMVRMAGYIPEEMPEEGSGYVDLWSAASDWDAAVLPEGWVDKENDYSLLVYKAIADWNVPYIGTSEMTETIDKAFGRLPCSINSIKELIRTALVYRNAKSLMDELFTLDTHSDLPEGYPRASIGRRSERQCSLPKMDEGHLDSQVLISFLYQGPNDEASSKMAAEKTLSQIGMIKDDVAKYPELCGIASTPEEALALNAKGKKAFFIGVENGYGIGNDTGNIRKLRDQGVIYITLCHFRDNAICNTSSHNGSNPAKGLTEFGKKVVGEMNRQGIMIDLSHASIGTFWDCIKYSKAPVICSHSGARDVYGHDRGLDDKQLKALAKNGGVIQVYSVSDFIGRPGSSMTVDDVMRHFNHCVEVAGAEHVGIGSDFDGGGGVIGCNGDNDMVNITVRMLEHGYTTDQIRGFWGGNFLRVMKEVQSIAGRD
jgi:microsomal dipeptidase-like Zn-dependent dipeptidase